MTRRPHNDAAPSPTAGPRRLALAVTTAATLVLAAIPGTPRTAQAATTTGTASNFTLIGHESLFGRGVNAAGTIYDHYMYIGSRSDGTHLHSGVQIVDIADPAHPKDIGDIPLPAQLSTGYTSRELRVWPQQKLLMVVYFGCSAILHGCVSPSDLINAPFQRINMFDLSDPTAPNLIRTYVPSTTPHELFLWLDPLRPGRALLFWTSPNSSSKQLVVTDLSGWRTAAPPEIATMATPAFSAADRQKFDTRLHSISVSPDGTRTYLAYLGGGVMVVDSSDLAAALPKPRLRLITPLSGRADWDNQGAHSTVRIPGKPYLFTTEEIYGKGVVLDDAFGPALGGCPWGWARIIDDHDDTHLSIASEFKIDENQSSACASVSTAQDNFSSYASHNPTVLPDVALLTWHSGGLRAVDLCDPLHPVQAGAFVPTPDTQPPTHTPDPALEPGSNGTIAWSYPIIRNGLIYYVDIANGLYVVRYTGRNAQEVSSVGFYEGNSNVGDAAQLPTGTCNTAAAQSSSNGAAAGTAGAAVSSTPNTGGAGGAPLLAAIAVIAGALAVGRRRRAAAG